MASTVVESSPPLSSTTAGLPVIASSSIRPGRMRPPWYHNSIRPPSRLSPQFPVTTSAA